MSNNKPTKIPYGLHEIAGPLPAIVMRASRDAVNMLPTSASLIPLCANCHEVELDFPEARASWYPLCPHCEQGMLPCFDCSAMLPAAEFKNRHVLDARPRCKECIAKLMASHDSSSRVWATTTSVASLPVWLWFNTPWRTLIQNLVSLWMDSTLLVGWRKLNYCQQ